MPLTSVDRFESDTPRFRAELEKTSRTPERIHALTSIRFFAALYVVICHTLRPFVPSLWNDGVWGRAIGLGYISVSFFFALSGYILAIVYLRRGTPVSARKFFKARFARIYPLFFLTLSLALPILFLNRWATFGLATASLKVGIIFVGEALFLNAWFPRLRGLDDANWSLGAEAFFYLTFPFLGPLLWKLRGYRLLLTGALVYVIGQAAVFISFHKLNWASVAHLPLLHISTFALGILLARWQVQKEQGDGPHTTNLVASIVALLSLASIVAVIYWQPHLRMWSFDDGLLAPAFLALIWSCSHSELLPARLLSARWLVVLGEASYGLYLFHSPIYQIFRRFGWNDGSIMFLVFAAVSIGVSVLSFYFYEAPMRRWILKWSRGLVKETMEAASDA